MIWTEFFQKESKTSQSLQIFSWKLLKLFSSKKMMVMLFVEHNQSQLQTWKNFMDQFNLLNGKYDNPGWPSRALQYGIIVTQAIVYRFLFTLVQILFMSKCTLINLFFLRKKLYSWFYPDIDLLIHNIMQLWLIRAFNWKGRSRRHLLSDLEDRIKAYSGYVNARSRLHGKRNQNESKAISHHTIPHHRHIHTISNHPTGIIIPYYITPQIYSNHTTSQHMQIHTIQYHNTGMFTP